jgi:hypothetical protein
VKDLKILSASRGVTNSKAAKSNRKLPGMIGTMALKNQFCVTLRYK